MDSLVGRVCAVMFVRSGRHVTHVLEKDPAGFYRCGPILFDEMSVLTIKDGPVLPIVVLS